MCRCHFFCSCCCRVASSSDVERAGICLLAEKCVAMCLASAACGTPGRDKSPYLSPEQQREKAQVQFPCTCLFFFFCASPRTRDLRCQPLNCLHLDAGLAPRLAGSCRLELLPSGNLQAIALHLRELCSSSALALALAHPVRRRHVFSSPLKQTAEALY